MDGVRIDMYSILSSKLVGGSYIAKLGCAWRACAVCRYGFGTRRTLIANGLTKYVGPCHPRPKTVIPDSGSRTGGKMGMDGIGDKKKLKICWNFFWGQNGGARDEGKTKGTKRKREREREAAICTVTHSHTQRANKIWGSKGGVVVVVVVVVLMEDELQCCSANCSVAPRMTVIFVREHARQEQAT
jgi:hypothetical protein